MNREKLFTARELVHESLLSPTNNASLSNLRRAMDLVIDELLEDAYKKEKDKETTT